MSGMPQRSVMKIEFLKWGNSLALRVPKAFAQQLGATEGKRATMTVENDALIIRVVKPRKRRRYSLDNLTNEITKENCHSEIDWGPPRGSEAW
jgi:antitoxin MazE